MTRIGDLFLTLRSMRDFTHRLSPILLYLRTWWREPFHNLAYTSADSPRLRRRTAGSQKRIALMCVSGRLTPYALKYLYVVVPISTSPIKMKRQWLAYCKVETSTSSVDISGSCSFKRVRYRVDALDKRSASMLLFFGWRSMKFWIVVTAGWTWSSVIG